MNSTIYNSQSLSVLWSTVPSLTKILAAISYLPIPLYAENFKVRRTILAAICKPLDIFDDSRSFQNPVVASLRNGNAFPLVNNAILELLEVTGRRLDYTTDDTSRRLTTVNITFVIPNLRTPDDYRQLNLARYVNHILLFVEFAVLVTLIRTLIYLALYTAAALISYLLAGTLIFTLQRHLIRINFALEDNIEENAYLTSAGGASLDVHAIMAHWNTSTIDVLAGYGSQLRSLTNLPARIARNHTVFKYTCRALTLVLTLQAALLTSIVRDNSSQAWGSAIWLTVFTLMHVPRWVFQRICIEPAEAILGRGRSHGARLVRSPPITFSGKRAALVFIETLPLTPKAERWEWINGFIPSDARRRKWQRDVEDLRLFNREAEGSDREKIPMEKWNCMLRKEVKKGTER